MKMMMAWSYYKLLLDKDKLNCSIRQIKTKAEINIPGKKKGNKKIAIELDFILTQFATRVYSLIMPMLANTVSTVKLNDHI